GPGETLRTASCSTRRLGCSTDRDGVPASVPRKGGRGRLRAGAATCLLPSSYADHKGAACQPATVSRETPAAGHWFRRRSGYLVSVSRVATAAPRPTTKR